MPWEELETYGHRVVRYSSADSGEVLAYCRSIDLAVETYEATRAKPPARGSRCVFTPRRNFKDQRASPETQG